MPKYAREVHIVRINIHKLHKIAYKGDFENDYQNKA